MDLFAVSNAPAGRSTACAKSCLQLEDLSNQYSHVQQVATRVEAIATSNNKAFFFGCAWLHWPPPSSFLLLQSRNLPGAKRWLASEI